jgi:6-phosphogluconolactonase
MKIEILPDAESACRRGAALIAAEARAAIAARGRFLLAVSGGKNPWKMFRTLAEEQFNWEKVDIMQVDERVAPDGDSDRNLTHLRESLLGYAPLRPEQIHAMPVNDPDLGAAAGRYAHTLEQLAGPQPVIDLVHLGLGPDGHTASLVPGDPVLAVVDVDVAATGVYQGRRRMTLTYPILNRARSILWLITDDSKADALLRLSKGDPTIPAGRIASDRARVLADRAAAARLGSSAALPQ